MQPPTAPPREALTEAQVVALIQDADALTVSAGAELLDMNLAVVEDITDDFVGGTVSRSSYANLHGTATLAVSRVLDWGRAIIRPHLTLSDGVTTARFHLGAYFTSMPSREVGREPEVFQIQGFDILHGLMSPVGDTYAVASGTAYLAAIETILTDQGFTGFIIDQHSVDSVLPTDRVWELDDRTTWLSVVNDLLASIGYRGIWSDWDGRLRCQRYLNPIDRAPEWYYTAEGEQSMIGQTRIRIRDFFDAPNRWVAVRSNNVDAAAPVEGDGIYTVVNELVGDTSVEARGRIITRVMHLDVADHAALVALADQSIAADLDLREKITLSTSPNPLCWHFDRFVLSDPAAGPVADVMGTQWTLPLDGSDQSHEWSCL